MANWNWTTSGLAVTMQGHSKGKFVKRNYYHGRFWGRRLPFLLFESEITVHKGHGPTKNHIRQDANQSCRHFEMALQTMIFDWMLAWQIWISGRPTLSWADLVSQNLTWKFVSHLTSQSHRTNLQARNASCFWKSVPRPWNACSTGTCHADSYDS